MNEKRKIIISKNIKPLRAKISSRRWNYEIAGQTTELDETKSEIRCR